MTSHLQMTEIPVKRFPGIGSFAVPVGKTKLLDQMKQSLRSRQFSQRTGRMYHQWEGKKNPDGEFEE